MQHCFTRWFFLSISLSPLFMLLPTVAMFARPPVVIIPGSLHSRLFLRQQHQQGRLVYPAYSAWSKPALQTEWINSMSLSRIRAPQGGGFIYSPPPALQAQNLSVGVSPDDFGRVDSIPIADPWTAPGPSTYTLLKPCVSQDTRSRLSKVRSPSCFCFPSLTYAFQIVFGPGKPQASFVAGLLHCFFCNKLRSPHMNHCHHNLFYFVFIHSFENK